MRVAVMARLMQVFLFHSFANLSLKTNSIIQPCSSQNTGLQNANPDYNQSHSCCTCSDSVGRIVQSRVQKDVWSVLCRCQVRRWSPGTQQTRGSETLFLFFQLNTLYWSDFLCMDFLFICSHCIHDLGETAFPLYSMEQLRSVL